MAKKVGLDRLDRITPEIEEQLPPHSRQLLAALRRIRQRLNRPTAR